MDLVYPPRLRLARLPTPLEPLDRLSAELGGPRLWIKRDDLSDCAASGNKIRKLEFVLAHAKDQGCDTLVTCGGLQSNHCRATAVLGARHGFRVRLVLRGVPESMPDGNLLIDMLCGASIEYHAHSLIRGRDLEFLARACEKERAAGYMPLLIPVGASDATGVWGYVVAAEELSGDFRRIGIEPRAIVFATGSGGTQAGLCAGMALQDLSTEVWGIAVCDDAEWFRNKIVTDLTECANRYSLPVKPDDLAIHVLDQYIGPGYARATTDVFHTIKHVARLEGILLDPVYTGKAMHGLIQEIRQGRFRRGEDVVFLHTGGLFGLFAQRGELHL